MKAHEACFRVYYEDTDAGGLMYHARYLAFAERARTEMLRSLGAPVSRLSAEHRLGFVVTKIDATYSKALHLDDLVTIRTALTALSAVRCSLRHTFERDSVLLSTLKVELACVNVDTGRPAPLPPLWRAALDSLFEVSA